jgi:hypothetical protein
MKWVDGCKGVCTRDNLRTWDAVRFWPLDEEGPRASERALIPVLTCVLIGISGLERKKLPQNGISYPGFRATT